jgi:hypothetical protein
VSCEYQIYVRTSMDVDATPAAASGGQSVTTLGVAQVVITPYNHSPSTPRGKKLVERARALSPSLIAPIVSPVFPRSSSASRVHTFMQGRTHPEPVLFEVETETVTSSPIGSSSSPLGMPALMMAGVSSASRSTHGVAASGDRLPTADREQVAIARACQLQGWLVGRWTTHGRQAGRCQRKQMCRLMMHARPLVVHRPGGCGHLRYR